MTKIWRLECGDDEDGDDEDGELFVSFEVARKSELEGLIGYFKKEGITNQSHASN